MSSDNYCTQLRSKTHFRGRSNFMTGLWFENEAMVRVTTVCTDSRNNKRYSAQTDLILGHTQGNYGVS